ncbi:MAG: hypothetical protein NTY71_07040 [Methanoregula sp.]|nr:hypothetical protein [Methanoregula sp.]
MRKAMDETCSNAGILKRAGRGLVIDIAGAEFFILEEDLIALMSNQMADVVNYDGEAEGLAWLSPLVAPKKMDLTAAIDHHIYIVSYGGFGHVVRGIRKQVVIKEYHPMKPAVV